MANELSYGPSLTGQSLSVLLLSQSAASGLVPLTEVSGSGLYLGNFPANPPGAYYAVVQDASGVQVSQPVQINWDGMYEVAQASSVTTSAISLIATGVVSTWKADPWEVLAHAIESGSTVYDPHAHTLTVYHDDNTVARVFSLHQSAGNTQSRSILS